MQFNILYFHQNGCFKVVTIDELRDDEEYSEILEDMREEGGKFGKHMLKYMHINTLTVEIKG